MGQYYRPLFIDQNGRMKVYQRILIIRTGFPIPIWGKLSEHAWWDNVWVNTVCSKLFNHPHKVVWMGDYGDDNGVNVNGLSKRTIHRFWRAVCRTHSGRILKFVKFSLEDKFLVNHTKGAYVDCNEYFVQSSNTSRWNTANAHHPIPLLTAVGNGLGGGDFEGEGQEHVGSWAGDLIEIVLMAPKEYKKQIAVFRKEE